MLERNLTDRLIRLLMRLPGIEDRATRSSLLAGIGVALNRADNQFVDLTNIISQLEPLGRLKNGERPVVILVHNAGLMVGGTDLAGELEVLEQEIEAAYGTEPLLNDLPTQPEALVFGGSGEWVTSTFLDQARRVGDSVARLRVPRFIDGVEEESIGALGTGWLIAPRLLLTNHHVVNARAEGERPAAEADFLTQAKHTTVWFDYYAEGQAKIEVSIEAVEASDASLDYALLRLADHAALHARVPIPIAPTPRKLERGTRLNVVQCPTGGPLRFAIRNNFFVGRGQRPFQIRYLTDTVQGSSGAPVMDDSWQVIALHHGAQMIDPKLYRGEPGVAGIVKYHNQGIEIHTIVASLPEAARVAVASAHRWGQAV